MTILLFILNICNLKKIRILDGQTNRFLSLSVHKAPGALNNNLYYKVGPSLLPLKHFFFKSPVCEI